ncbi:hypothetical protein [Streptomyces sp. NPDC048496]|uniref:hypothetical protein n=1 Tax=Streptomyces sp. NPDC048496 TaxID=3365558 RepID=UPI003714C21E
MFPDDSGDRKSGHATAYVSRQYPGSRGQVRNGMVATTTARADERVHYPPHTVADHPTDAMHLPRRELRHVAPAATAMPRPRELTIQCGRGKPPLDSPRVNTPRISVPDRFSVPEPRSVAETAIVIRRG